jgi:hypothetical protein
VWGCKLASEAAQPLSSKAAVNRSAGANSDLRSLTLWEKSAVTIEKVLIILAK